MNAVHFSSATPEWATPQDLFDQLNAEFRFTLDVCATPENAKCAKFYTREQDGLEQEWGYQRVWCNPPYGREIGRWVQRCAEARGLKEPCYPELAVMLIPARTDTRWWHAFIWDAETHKPYPNVSVRLLRGRLKFGGSKNSAPFPSAIVVFK